MEEMFPHVLTINDICKIMSIGKNAAYALVKTPGFPLIRAGQRKILINGKLFREWLDARASPPSEQ